MKFYLMLKKSRATINLVMQLFKEAKEEAAKNRIEGAAPFKPTGTGNSIPQPSILFHTYGSGAN